MKTTFLPWIEKHWDKLDWSSLSSNRNAISISTLVRSHTNVPLCNKYLTILT